MQTVAVRLVGFVVLYCSLYLGLSSFWSAGLSRWVIDVVTVGPAAWLARHLSGNSAIVASGSQLQAPDGSINILYGCEGTDVLLVLFAGVLVAPASWRKRLLGLAAGTAFVFVINQARILALFFAFRLHRDWFGALHGLVTPVVVVVVVVAFFLSWLRWQPTKQPARDARA